MTRCRVCGETTGRDCCRSSYDDVTPVGTLSIFIKKYIFTDSHVFSDARAKCFRANVSYNLQYLEYLSQSQFEHPAQRNHVSVYTILIKQYCSGVFSIIEAYLEWKWLKDRKTPPPSKLELLNQSRRKNYLPSEIMDELDWLLSLRNKLHLSKILQDYVRGVATNQPFSEYDWNSFNNREYLRARELLKTFVLNTSGLSLNHEDFHAAFGYLIAVSRREPRFS